MLKPGAFGPIALALALCFSCGDGEDGGTQAQRHGVGAACAGDEDCAEPGQACLDFKGGYCGVADCASDEDCPSGSACVRRIVF
jgi:hypothetical protein